MGDFINTLFLTSLFQRFVCPPLPSDLEAVKIETVSIISNFQSTKSRKVTGQ